LEASGKTWKTWNVDVVGEIQSHHLLTNVFVVFIAAQGPNALGSGTAEEIPGAGLSQGNAVEVADPTPSAVAPETLAALGHLAEPTLPSDWSALVE
jgi:hypothetical protein